MKDKFMLWVISGIIGAIFMDIYSFLAKQMGLAQHYIWHISADIFIEPEAVATISGTILGLLADLVIGSVLGVIIGLLIEYSGSKYYLFKGWGVGLFAWLLFYGVLQHTLPHTETSAPKDALSNLSSFVEHSIFGLVSAWAYMKLAWKNLNEQ